LAGVVEIFLDVAGGPLLFSLAIFRKDIVERTRLELIVGVECVFEILLHVRLWRSSSEQLRKKFTVVAEKFHQLFSRERIPRNTSGDFRDVFDAVVILRKLVAEC